MSAPSEKSPGGQFRFTNKNSPNGSRNFRSPFTSPRDGNPDFLGSSPMKNNFTWRNNSRFQQNDHQNQYYTPRGSRRGGGNFRGRGHHRGSPRNNNADISLYVNTSMLEDPWKDLAELLQPRVENSIKVKVEPATDSRGTTPNVSLSSINSSASNNDSEQVTEDSLLTSDTSADGSHHTVEENVPPQNAQPTQ